nr:hypothetical protein CFP56_26179 [Quercus suber]
MNWVHAKLEVGLEWSEVRLSETEKKREKTHRHRGENSGVARRSVGGARTSVGEQLKLSLSFIGAWGRAQNGSGLT